jgi:hypothetical protein
MISCKSGTKTRGDFEKWLMSYDGLLSFQNIEKKSLYEAVEIIVWFIPSLSEEETLSIN